MTQTFVNSMPTLRQKDIRDSLFPLYVVAVYIGKRSPGCGMSTDRGAAACLRPVIQINIKAAETVASYKR